MEADLIRSTFPITPAANLDFRIPVSIFHTSDGDSPIRRVHPTAQSADPSGPSLGIYEIALIDELERNGLTQAAASKVVGVLFDREMISPARG